MNLALSEVTSRMLMSANSLALVSRRALFAFLLFCMICIAGVSSSRETQDGISFGVVAVVNRSAISDFDVRKRMNFLSYIGSKGDKDALYKAALESLISDYARIDKAKKAGIEATPTLISNGLTKLAKKNGVSPENFLKDIKKKGISEEDIKVQLHADFVWTKLVQHRYAQAYSVSQKDIEREIDYRKKFENSPAYKVYELVVRFNSTTFEPKKALKKLTSDITTKLRRAKNFESVAREMSISPSSQYGGYLGWLDANTLQPDIRQILQSMLPKHLSRPIIFDTNKVRFLYLDQIRKPISLHSQKYHLKEIFFPLPSDIQSHVVSVKLHIAHEARNALQGCKNIDSIRGKADLQINDFGKIFPMQIDSSIRNDVLALQAGEVTYPLRSPKGLHIFALCSIEAVDFNPNDIRDEIHQKQISEFSQNLLQRVINDAIIQRKDTI
jgi:peptidyl-prolyl cis-trans isomerase SurA